MTAEEFNEILRVIRETVRAEIRAEFEGRKAIKALALNTYQVPTVMHGQPI